MPERHARELTQARRGKRSMTQSARVNGLAQAPKSSTTALSSTSARMRAKLESSTTRTVFAWDPAWQSGTSTVPA